MINGMIKLNDYAWFSSKDYGLNSYLWKDGDSIYISWIYSHKKGNFKLLVDKLKSFGLTIKIPNPLPSMERIVRKNGYTQTWEEHSLPNESGGKEMVEVWVL